DRAARPFVGRQLAVWVPVPDPCHHHQLLLGKPRIDYGQRDRMEGKIPGGVPWVLPFVGHRHDVGVFQMSPLVVAASFALWRGWRLCGITFQPSRNFIMEILLAPNHAGERLSL